MLRRLCKSRSFTLTRAFRRSIVGRRHAAHWSVDRFVHFCDGNTLAVHVRPAKVCTVVLCTLLSQASKGVLTATWADAAIIHDHIVKSATHFEEILDVLGVAA